MQYPSSDPYLKAADEFFALSKTAETPFMRAYYERIALRYLSSEGELKAATGEIVKQGRGGLHFRAFDLAEVDSIPAFVKELRDEFGAIYGLVNNAGIGTEGLLATMHNTEIEALLRQDRTEKTDLAAAFALLREVLDGEAAASGRRGTI